LPASRQNNSARSGMNGRALVTILPLAFKSRP
jgi:hypothetical protein